MTKKVILLQESLCHNDRMMRGMFISTDFLQKLVSEVQDGPNTAAAEQREVNNLYPLLMKHNRGMESWNTGNSNTHIILINVSHIVKVMVLLILILLFFLRS